VNWSPSPNVSWGDGNLLKLWWWHRFFFTQLRKSIFSLVVWTFIIVSWISCVNMWFFFVDWFNLDSWVHWTLIGQIYVKRFDDESTSQGGQKCCHIVLLSKGVHVWISTMVILEHIYPNFLHNMVDYNTKNSITKKIPLPTYIVQFQSIFVAKKCMSLCTKKCKYTQKVIEMIFNL
jgi:hypothetical protein